MPFQPGKSGNPEGSKDRAAFLRVLNRAIAQDDGKRLRDAVEKLLDLASGGEQWAVQMLADRLDGKPAQAVTIGNEAGETFSVTWKTGGDGNV
jgi:hypothetical protein